MKILKRLAVLALVVNLIVLAETVTCEMSVVVLLNSGLLLYLERRVKT